MAYFSGSGSARMANIFGPSENTSKGLASEPPRTASECRFRFSLMCWPILAMMPLSMPAWNATVMVTSPTKVVVRP
jgi:hypothetical protein